jgi:hypothetical protein
VIAALESDENAPLQTRRDGGPLVLTVPHSVTGPGK